MIGPRLPLTMLGFEEALDSVLDRATRLEPEWCPLDQSLGRVLHDDVYAGACLPPFDNAAMDGFALRVGDDGARAGAEFAVNGRLAAGDGVPALVGSAIEIMTGACVPASLDAVVPVEQASVLARHADGSACRIRLLGAAAVHQHIRRTGTDVAPGTRIVCAGEPVQPQHLMLFAALGATPVAVTRTPRVAVICTGRELVDDPSRALQPGQIRNGNGLFLAARIAAAGAQCVYRATVGDDADSFLAALASARQARADVVLSTGAVSMGAHDFVPEALRRAGADIAFHKVRMRPGKPLLFARLADGVAFFGLPGNPVAAAVGMRFFVEPMLRAMLGMPAQHALQATLAETFEKRAPMTFFLKTRLYADALGGLCAEVLPGQESFRVLPLAVANAWAVVPEAAMRLQRGATVAIHGLGHLQPPAIDSDWRERAAADRHARAPRAAAGN
jgi:molybdopterin molybdotransferase